MGFQEELVKEINKVRTDGPGYATQLEELLGKYEVEKNADGKEQKVLLSDDGRTGIVVQEGRHACEDAIRVLKSSAAVEPVTLSPGLSQSQLDLVSALGPLGQTGTTLPDGTPASDRLVRYGRWRGGLSELVSYGPSSPSEVVRHWLLDDGNPQRPQRSTLLSPDMRVVGVAHGPHTSHGFMTLVAFTHGYDQGAKAVVEHDAAKAVVEHGAPPPASSSSARPSNASELKESADGKGFMVHSGPLGVPKDALTLKKQGSALVLEVRGAGKTTEHTYRLPFDFSAAGCSARYDPESKAVTVVVPKPGSDGPLVSGEQVVGEPVELLADPTSAEPKVAVAVTETADGYQVALGRSKFAHSLTLSIVDSKTLVLQFKHRVPAEDNDGFVTHTRKENLGLPFFLAPANIVLSSANPSSISILIRRPTSASNADSLLTIQ